MSHLSPHPAFQVQWQHCMGEVGAQSSTPVTAPDAPRREVEVKMQALPSALVVGHPQKAILTITNNLERPLHLQLQVSGSSDTRTRVRLKLL